MHNIIVIGGGGYCGNVLVPKLLDSGHFVTVFDTFWYDRATLPPESDKFKVIKGDVRDIEAVSAACVGKTHVIHLACISNDASFELDENLSTSINLESFEPLVVAAKQAGVGRFVFASTSSVYGLSDKPDVREDHPQVPLTLYNKYKGMCEPLLFKHTDENFVGVAFRPATVCGYSPRQRLDVSVNILTNHAVHNRKIMVFGGDQLRPNLHIDDYVAVCMLLLDADQETIADEVFNVGAQNMRIIDLAEVVKSVVEEEMPELAPIELEVTSSDDKRSYHINSDKIKDALGFVPQSTVEDAVRDLCGAFSRGDLPNSFDDDQYYNIRTMKAINAK